jgi:hypothetical protein
MVLNAATDFIPTRAVDHAELASFEITHNYVPIVSAALIQSYQ